MISALVGCHATYIGIVGVTDVSGCHAKYIGIVTVTDVSGCHATYIGKVRVADVSGCHAKYWYSQTYRRSGMSRNVYWYSHSYRRFGTNYGPIQKCQAVEEFLNRPIRRLETSLTSYDSTLRNIPEERIFIKLSAYGNKIIYSSYESKKENGAVKLADRYLLWAACDCTNCGSICAEGYRENNGRIRLWSRVPEISKLQSMNCTARTITHSLPTPSYIYIHTHTRNNLRLLNLMRINSTFPWPLTSQTDPT